MANDVNFDMFWYLNEWGWVSDCLDFKLKLVMNRRSMVYDSCRCCTRMPSMDMVQHSRLVYQVNRQLQKDSHQPNKFGDLELPRQEPTCKQEKSKHFSTPKFFFGKRKQNSINYQMDIRFEMKTKIFFFQSFDKWTFTHVFNHVCAVLVHCEYLRMFSRMFLNQNWSTKRCSMASFILMLNGIIIISFSFFFLHLSCWLYAVFVSLIIIED